MKIKQKELAKKLASYADVYVNDAFGTAHRAHGTTAVIADYFPADKRMFGFLINSELAAMDRGVNNAQRPFTAIMGEQKYLTRSFLWRICNRIDNLIIGGRNDLYFYKGTREGRLVSLSAKKTSLILL